MKQIKVYKCTVCGNIILKLEDKTEALSCCDSPMIMLKVNRTDGAVEKHVPYIKEKVKDCKATGTTIYNIQVGNIPHPMETEHYINWIGSFSNDAWVIKWLKPGDKPERNLRVDPNSTLYEYCNVHGLWKK